MKKQEIMNKVESLLNEDYKAQYEYYTENEDYIDNYGFLPQEENYSNSIIYDDNSWLISGGAEEQEFYQPLLEKYGYHDMYDLLDDLYSNCEVKSTIMHGYGYNIHNCISLGSYRVEEEEIQFSDGAICDLLKQLTNEEIKELDTEYYIADYSTHSDYLAYIYLSITIVFYVDIADAIKWLEENKSN